PNRRRRAHRGDDVEGVPLRFGIARRVVSGGIAGRPRGVPLARRAGAAEVRAARAQGTAVKRSCARLAARLALVLFAATLAAQPFDSPLVLSLSMDERLRSEEHTSELQSLRHLVCRLLLEKKK